MLHTLFDVTRIEKRGFLGPLVFLKLQRANGLMTMAKTGACAQTRIIFLTSLFRNLDVQQVLTNADFHMLKSLFNTLWSYRNECLWNAMRIIGGLSPKSDSYKKRQQKINNEIIEILRSNKLEIERAKHKFHAQAGNKL